MSNAFAPIVRARPNPIFGRPVHQGSPPIDYSPILLLKPHYPHLFVYLRERESVKRRFREMIGFSPKEYERCWQQIIREGVETGEFRAELDIQVASYGLLGMLNWLYKWYDPQGRLSVQEVAEQFTSLALAGLAAAPAAPKHSRRKPAR